MYKLKRILFIHMVLIYFTFIYSQSHSARTLVHASTNLDSSQTPVVNEETTTTTTTTTDHPEDIDLTSLPKEQRKLSKEQLAEIAKGLFNVENLPTQTTQPITKAYVPRAMLEKYLKTRESVRDIIPEDPDFYGKININDLDQTHEEFWSAVYNKYGSYDIEVDMGRPDQGLESRRFNFKGDVSHIAHVGPESDPEDVPPNVEPILPPHSRSTQSQKQFVSVHLKFNLSQECYTKPNAAEDLRGAELHLAREKLFDCEFNNCKRKPVPFFKSSQQHASESNGRQKTTVDRDNDDEDQDNLDTNRLHRVPRYQRIYVLQIFKYDDYGEPITRIHGSQRLDTRESTPVVFNIYPIVKYWLIHPKHNHGIIVRIANDDKAYEQALEFSRTVGKIPPPRSDSDQTATNSSTNASSSNQNYDPIVPEDHGVAEHVRLKRGFRSASDGAESWLRKQPSILIYSQPSDVERRHVKRHQTESEETDGMQADEPDTVTSDYTSSSTSTGSSVDYNQRLPSESSRGPLTTTTDRSFAAHPFTSTSIPASRREQTMTNNGRRGHNRNHSNGRTHGQNPGNHRSRGKPKQMGRNTQKCSKRSLVINFDEVGWSSWIIAPQAYHANYCAGDCSWPLTDIQNATNHAIIQSIYNSVGHSAPKSCCAPVKLGTMAILYQLDGIVQLRHYDDMIVEACGCL